MKRRTDSVRRPKSATVQVANEIHPIKLLDCLRPIPANTTVPIDVVIQGDIDGGRANLAIVNEYRIILPRPEGTTSNNLGFQKWGWSDSIFPSRFG